MSHAYTRTHTHPHAKEDIHLFSFWFSLLIGEGIRCWNHTSVRSGVTLHTIANVCTCTKYIFLSFLTLIRTQRKKTHSPTGKAFIQKRKSCTKNKCINYLNAYARVQKIRFYTLIVIVVCAEMISISYVYTVIKIVFVALIRGVVQQCRERCFTNGGKMGLWS